MAYYLDNDGLLISFFFLPPKCILASSPYLFQCFFLIQASHFTRILILAYGCMNTRIHFAFGKMSGGKERKTFRTNSNDLKNKNKNFVSETETLPCFCALLNQVCWFILRQSKVFYNQSKNY